MANYLVRFLIALSIFVSVINALRALPYPNLRCAFWSIRYALYDRDLYTPLRDGRESKENPLTVDDLAPLMKALRRLDACRAGIRQAEGA